jgi:ATP synthase protein I
MLGGAAIGWALDQLLDTSPWLLLVMLFLGTAAGFWNIIKLSN